MEFRAASAETVGMELELQLLKADSLDLVDGILSLMELLPDHPYVKPESIQNTVEIVSPVCRSVDELDAAMRPVLTELHGKCRALGMALCGAGTHPFGERLALITPRPRYLAMEERAGYLMHSQITFATHVHLGMPDGDEAVALMRAIRSYLPLLIAISASSPYWRGYDTGCASYRHRILSASRSYGVPPSFPDWAAFCRFFETTREAGLFQSDNDIHWDIRPRPRFGSLEVRAMDSQPTLTEALGLAAFVRALAAFLRTEPPAAELPQPLPWWIEKENHYQASLRGLEAVYIYSESGAARPLAAVWQEVLAAVAPAAAALGESAYLERLRNTVAAGVSYRRQRQARGRGTMRAVVQALVDELEADLAVSS